MKNQIFLILLAVVSSISCTNKEAMRLAEQQKCETCTATGAQSQKLVDAQDFAKAKEKWDKERNMLQKENKDLRHKIDQTNYRRAHIKLDTNEWTGQVFLR